MMGIVEELQAEVQRLHAEVQEWKNSRKRSFDEAVDLHQFLAKSENKVRQLETQVRTVQWIADDRARLLEDWKTLNDRAVGKLVTAITALKKYAALGAITGACARQALKEIGE